MTEAIDHRETRHDGERSDHEPEQARTSPPDVSEYDLNETQGELVELFREAALSFAENGKALA